MKILHKTYTFILTTAAVHFRSLLYSLLTSCMQLDASISGRCCSVLKADSDCPSSPAVSEDTQEVRTAFNTADPGTSCRAAVIQPEMRFSYGGFKAIASPGENLVLIRDNFKGLGRGKGASDKDTGTFQCSSYVFAYSHNFFPERMMNNHLHDSSLPPPDPSVAPSNRLIM